MRDDGLSILVEAETAAEAIRGSVTMRAPYCGISKRASAAVLLQEHRSMTGKRVGILLTGGAIDRPIYTDIIGTYEK